MSITRRHLLRRAGGFAAWVALPVGCADVAAEGVAQSSALGAGEELAFLHGVASGDPLPDAVILWTRVTPSAEPALVALRWEVSTDLAFRELVASGELTTDATRDFTAKVDAQGLAAGTLYYYRFVAGEISSPIGRTRTAPNGSVARLRFGVASCSSYAHGYFHGYRSLSERLDLDAVIHLGDYIYEYGTGEYGKVREYEPAHELVTLSDYRTRYAQYRRDPDLQALHQQLPMIVVWDDHEVANDSWTDGAQNHMPAREGAFKDRLRAATQAHAEWMPTREQAHGGSFRSFAFGDLVDLIMLDTRNWGRAQQRKRDDLALDDPERTLLGHDQEAWLGEQLSASRARWRLLGQQVMVSPFAIGTNLDSWEGYPAARSRLLQQLTAAPGDAVVLTGDVHSSWAMDVLDQQGERSLAVELVTPGISSPLLSREQAEQRDADVQSQPHVRYAQLWKRGYMVVDVDRARVQAAWYQYESVEQPERIEPVFGAAAAAYSGERRVRMEPEPAPSAESPGEAAPRLS
jgi:alkaline phosphatase D